MKAVVIAQKSPYIVTLEPGTHYWCACGLSKNQPFCDGSHTESSVGPKEVVIKKKQEVALCGCKQTKNPPYCDGSHNDL